MHIAKSAWRRSKFGSEDGVQSSLVSVKEKQATIAHFSAVEDGLGKFLKLMRRGNLETPPDGENEKS